MIKNKLSILVFVFIAVSCSKKPVARFELIIEGSEEGIDQYIKVDLDSITDLPTNGLQLLQIKDGQKISIPFQLELSEHPILFWRVDAAENGILKYELIKKSGEGDFKNVETENREGTVTISADGSKLLRYNSQIVYPPAGVDSIFKRSGFIHPLWTPNGQVLTRIQPPDHYHHYGIWNPWTHVLFEGDTIDFWNLYKKNGTVRFSDFISQNSGSLFAEYTVHHEHVVFKNDSTEVIALNELQTVRVSKTTDKDYYFVDFTIEMECGTKSPFLLLEYRYGGFGWRAIETWNPENSEVLTSENKTRKDVDGTTARWCIVQGELGTDYGGIVIFSHPENYNHPEPLRIWPEDSNGGEMFVNVAPTKTMDWLLEPDTTYTLRYRLIVFNGHFTKEQAEIGWQQYTQVPEVIIER
jgi:hypothetical protein